MIQKSSIEAEFRNLKNYSVRKIKIKFLDYRISRIINQIEKISKNVNISPNKRHYGVIELIQKRF